MAHGSDVRFLVIHGVRLKGFGEPPAIGAAVGLSESDVSGQLTALQTDGFVLRRDGRLTGWALTKEGRVEQQRLAAAELDATGTRDAVRDGYERFLALNAGMLGLCTDWQLRGDAPNDHGDPAYDADVIDRLRATDAGLAPILVDLAAALDRYGSYRPRFQNALAQLDAGALEYFTKPIIDSYHTIWFELHEDLLSSLGIERSQEGSGT